MKNYFLGLFPDPEVSKRIAKTTIEIRKIFASQGINVKWVEPEKYHLSLLFIGHQISFLRKLIIKNRVNNYHFSPFNIEISGFKAGISNRYRELVFMTIGQGADQLRELVTDLSMKTGVQRDQVFIPHITLGRVGKDLTDQEYSNILTEVKEIVMLEPIIWQAKKIDFVLNDLDKYLMIN